jgi:cation-transporting ATPase 13A3/4/5
MSSIESLAFYTIGKYDKLCEDHFKIKKIVPIRKTFRKILLNIILNIFTGGMVQLIYGIFPNFKHLICYDDCSLKEGERLYIICEDGKYYFEEIKKCALPKINNQDLIIPQLEDNSELIMFKFKLFSYIYNFSTNQFDSLRFEMNQTKQYILEKMIDGLKDDERLFQNYIYGKADLIFPVKSFFKTLYYNMCDFFFIFQAFAILLWFLTDFKIYATIISLLVLYNLIDSTIETRNNLINLRKMSKYSIEIKLLKDRKIEKIDSADLVPGDIFVLPKNGNSVPCDCILLTGSVIVNEAMLTGESTPIIKTHILDMNKKFDYKTDYKHILYYGTKIVQKRAENKQPILCLCYSTGFNTVRGNLIRSVIYPKEGDNSFLVDSFKFLKIIGIIFALGFLVVLPIKIKRIIRSDEKKELQYIDINKGQYI